MSSSFIFSLIGQEQPAKVDVRCKNRNFHPNTKKLLKYYIC